MNNRKEQLTVIAIIIIALTSCSFLLFKAINTLRYQGVNPEDIIYKNDIKSDIDYLVYLKPNVFFERNYIDDEYLFVTSLTDYIKTTFNYDFVGNEDLPLSYDYYIKGTITSNYISDINKAIKPIWVKEYILLDHKTGKTSDSKINITETLNIDINYYNAILDSINNYLLIPLNSSFDISLIVDINGGADGQKIQKEHKMMMSIPLGTKVYDIKVSKSFPNQEVMYRSEPKSLETSYMISIIYIILIIGIVFATYYYIKKTVYKEKNEYLARVNKILKEYDDRIVTVSNFIRYDKMEIVNIPHFDELLTFSDETLEPIIYWEKRESKHIEAWFSIIRDKILYRYMIVYDKKQSRK